MCSWHMHPDEGGGEHMIAIINWHSKVKKRKHRLQERLYGEVTWAQMVCKVW